MNRQSGTTNTRDTLLDELKEALAGRQWSRARNGVDFLLDTDRRFVTYQEIAKLHAEYSAWQDNLVPCKIALLGNGTLDICKSYLLGEGLRRGLDLDIYVGPYNQYASVILDADSPLAAFRPDLIAFYWDFESIVSRLLDRPAWTDVSRCDAFLAGIVQEWRSLQAAISEKFGCLTLWPTLSSASSGPGILDGLIPNSPRCWEQRLNSEVNAIAASYSEAFAWDLSGLMNRVGLERWEDRRLRILGDVPCAHEWWPRVARQIVRYAAVLKGKACKLVIMDADNTLWGGVVGEDGVQGLSIRSGINGDVYRRIQAWLLGLKSRGILITVASKNNPEDVDQVFAEHDDMLLTTDDIAAWSVGWDPKPGNVKNMLKALNLSGEQAVFIDDSHVERALMRSEMPEITVPELPQDVSIWPTFLGNAPWFDSFSLTPEDELRTRLYLEEKKRTDALAEVATMSVEDKESFYLKLQVEVEAFWGSSQTVSRLAQMTQRTNQFNFTTLRLTEGEIEKMSNDPAFEVIGARVRDRYGDYGICSLIILRYGDKAVLENLLLSCRALGRGVENALRRLVILRARARGYKECEVLFTPSAKNIVAETFLKAGDSTWEEENGENRTLRFIWTDKFQGHGLPDTAKLIGSMIGD